LTIGIHVHNDVCAVGQAGVQASLEGAGQSFVFGVMGDEVCASLTSHLNRVIGGAIVHDNDFDAIYACDLAGNFVNNRANMILLIERAKLDKQGNHERQNNYRGALYICTISKNEMVRMSKMLSIA
jgi:hypothetical protein